MAYLYSKQAVIDFAGEAGLRPDLCLPDEVYPLMRSSKLPVYRVGQHVIKFGYASAAYPPNNEVVKFNRYLVPAFNIPTAEVLPLATNRYSATCLPYLGRNLQAHFDSPDFKPFTTAHAENLCAQLFKSAGILINELHVVHFDIKYAALINTVLDTERDQLCLIDAESIHPDKNAGNRAEFLNDIMQLIKWVKYQTV